MSILKDPTSRAYVASPTWEAHWLFDQSGADPYLEDTASLWLLHWWLLAKPCYVPTWWVAFHAQPSSRFTLQDLAETTMRHVRLAGWEPPAEASVTKDADCLTKMYARKRDPNAGSPGNFEDILDSPFRELGLLEATSYGRGITTQRWLFTSSARTSLPSKVVAYVCLDYAARNEWLGQGGSMALARLANEPGGPGRAFRLREPEIAEALNEVASEYSEISVAEGIGQRSLSFSGNPRRIAWTILDDHYGRATERISCPTRKSWYECRPSGMWREMLRRNRTDLLDLQELAQLTGASA